MCFDMKKSDRCYGSEHCTEHATYCACCHQRIAAGQAAEDASACAGGAVCPSVGSCAIRGLDLLLQTCASAE